MAQFHVKRIPVESHSASWDEGWLRPGIIKPAQYARDRVFAASSRLAYWGGLAGILGSILWTISFLPSQFYELDLVSLEPLGYVLDFLGLRQLLVIPLLLFWLCLAGLCLLQEEQRSRSPGLRRIGFVISSLGFNSVISFTLNADESAHWFVGSPSGFIYSNWARPTHLGLMLLEVGLALFGIAAIRAKILPIRILIWFLITSLALFLVPKDLTDAKIPGYDTYHLIYADGVFVTLLLFFGASWAMMGYALVRRQGRRSR